MTTTVGGFFGTQANASTSPFKDHTIYAGTGGTVTITSRPRTGSAVYNVSANFESAAPSVVASINPSQFAITGAGTTPTNNNGSAGIINALAGITINLQSAGTKLS